MGNKLATNDDKECTIIFEGIQCAGKRTILEKVKQLQIETTIPEIGVTWKTLSVENYKFTSVDIGGRSSTRTSRRHYYKKCRGYVFVVDSSAEVYMAEAKYEFQSCLKEENLKDAVFLVLANKQDKPGAANVQEVIELLGLWDDTTHNCNIFGTCATTGEGLSEAMAWLSEALIEAEEQRVLEQQAVEVSTTKPTAHSKGGPLGYLRKITGNLKTACAH